MPNYHNPELANDWYKIASLSNNQAHCERIRRHIETFPVDLPVYYQEHKTLRGLPELNHHLRGRLENILEFGIEALEGLRQQRAQQRPHRWDSKKTYSHSDQEDLDFESAIRVREG